MSKFIKKVVDFGIDLYQPFTWTPLYYKGTHISGPDYKKHYSGIKNLKYRGIIRRS